MSKVTVGKWGKNLAVRIPGEIVEVSGLKDGERVEIEAREEGIVIRRLVPRMTAEEMFKGLASKTWRKAYAEAFDWGGDKGRETLE
jgi:antitoxin component of MazEF toxin-antitoxin module